MSEDQIPCEGCADLTRHKREGHALCSACNSNPKILELISANALVLQLAARNGKLERVLFEARRFLEQIYRTSREGSRETANARSLEDAVDDVEIDRRLFCHPNVMVEVEAGKEYKVGDLVTVNYEEKKNGSV